MRGALTDLKPQIRDVRLAIRNQTTGGQLDLWLQIGELRGLSRGQLRDIDEYDKQSSLLELAIGLFR